MEYFSIMTYIQLLVNYVICYIWGQLQITIAHNFVGYVQLLKCKRLYKIEP